MDLKGRKILISGGTTGIGRATALELVRAGARVVTFGRGPQQLEEVIALSEGKIAGLNADVSSPQDVKKVFELVDKELGGLDILINNAGLGGGNLFNSEVTDVEYLINTNILGYIVCTKLAFDRLSKDGHVVNIGSLSTVALDPSSSVYVATKSAVKGFTDSLRKEANKRGFKLTLIEPGSVFTDMTESSERENLENVAELRMLMPDDIAKAVMYCLESADRIEIRSLQIKPLKQVI